MAEKVLTLDLKESRKLVVLAIALADLKPSLERLVDAIETCGIADTASQEVIEMMEALNSLEDSVLETIGLDVVGATLEALEGALKENEKKETKSKKATKAKKGAS